MDELTKTSDLHELIIPSVDPGATFDNTAVMIMFNLIREDIKITNKKMDDLVNCASCDKCHLETKESLNKLEKRLKPVEDVCTGFQAIRHLIPSTADVLQVKSDTIHEARDEDKSLSEQISKRFDAMDNSITDINKKLEWFDAAYWSGCKVKSIVVSLLKNNHYAQATFCLILLSFLELNSDTFLIILGRTHDFLQWP